MLDSIARQRRARAGAAALALSVAALALPPRAIAQAGHEHHGGGATLPVSEEAAAHRAMEHRLAEGAHVRLTPVRAPRAGDAERTARVLSDLRGGLERYRDYRTALEDGYRIFAPHIEQRVYHFTNFRRAVRERRRFEPAEPSSLLYQRTEDGYRLAGAMYSAPRDATPDELDARVPLSVARWHAHVDICLPRFRDRERWGETRKGRLLFGPAGTIATRTECEAENGRFFEQLFGWMVHVNALETDSTKIWGH